MLSSVISTCLYIADHYAPTLYRAALSAVRCLVSPSLSPYSQQSGLSEFSYYFLHMLFTPCAARIGDRKLIKNGADDLSSCLCNLKPRRRSESNEEESNKRFWQFPRYSQMEFNYSRRFLGSVQRTGGSTEIRRVTSVVGTDCTRRIVDARRYTHV